ncbi:MAG TPA: hypothetical protein VGN83_00175 [Falsiroseomonas sp.]|nr:hypothetical protein [Falsiroseomonas sp.]
MSTGPIDPEVLRRMREVISTTIASRRSSIVEATAEARGLGRGLQPALPATTIDAALTDILRDLGAYQSQAAVEVDGQWLRLACPEEVADSLAYAMRFDSTGKTRRTGVEYAATIAAEQLVRQLAMSGFVVMRRGTRPSTDGA